MRAAVAIAALTLLGSLATARAENCTNPQTQADMNDCAGADFKVSDGQLNAVYQQILGRLHAADVAKQRLVAAEKGWIRFRDAECAFATSASEGGSAFPMLETMCKTNLTKERIKQLTNYLHCDEGDMSCPVPPR